jgi:amino acid transporter/nucleotide-binding universal stress UspA family protein
MQGLETSRKVGLLGASSIGVAAIVGGGILALSGVALSTAGPAAMVAFAANGVIALLTALSFTELASAFPHSGGAYAFAKRVLNVHTAFGVGWIVWFASVVAGVLYAVGFGVYSVIALRSLWEVFAEAPSWLADEWLTLPLATLIIGCYAFALLKPPNRAGDWATYGKLGVFVALLIGGVIAFGLRPLEQSLAGLTPFAPGGVLGIIQAMGFTFIAIQGFAAIVAVAGEIRAPERTILRAALITLATATIVNVLLLFLTTTIGLVPGEDIVRLSQRHQEAIVLVTTRRYLGAAGYWLAVSAALLSMASALRTNIFISSRIAFNMAKDRTLPSYLARRNARGAPAAATVLSSGMMVLLLLALPDVASAGAAASLIFLLSFALVHLLAILARMRLRRASPWRFGALPLVPVLGGAACLLLAGVQGVVVPAAGIISLLWLIAGLGVYVVLFAQRAKVLDAALEGRDPALLQLRGRSPLVLVPIANPDSAAALVTIANALTPPRVGRVLLLSVVRPDAAGVTAPLSSTQRVLSGSLTTAYALGLAPEALTTIADDPWREIARVAGAYHCESLLLGLSRLDGVATKGSLATLLAAVDCDVAVLQAPTGWQLATTRRLVVPVAGGSQHDALRARLIASFQRQTARAVLFLRVLPPETTAASYRRAERALKRVAEAEVYGQVATRVIRSDAILQAILSEARPDDLLILGSERTGRTRGDLGGFAKRLARQAHCAVLILSRKV